MMLPTLSFLTSVPVAGSRLQATPFLSRGRSSVSHGLIVPIFGCIICPGNVQPFCIGLGSGNGLNGSPSSVGVHFVWRMPFLASRM